MKLKVVLVAVCLFIVTSAALAFSRPQSDGKPELSIESMDHAFGKVKPGTPLSYSFVIKNTGKTDLEIKNVAPSCGCTTSNYDKVIAPGAEGKITLAVEKTDAYKGEVTKTATVSTNDPAHASFQLTLKAMFVAE